MTHHTRSLRERLHKPKKSLLVFSLACSTVASSMPPASSQTVVPVSVQTSSVRADETASSQMQGRRYGEAGFIGEPISLNLVNADIRDILNYITEQYNINFVIDNSVKAVPVTVNVTEVPWNVALDAILRANRLAIDAQGSILRVATQEVLASEIAIQERIKESQLGNSPLVTEFIRLNYARASGTLAQAAGSTGGFAGGTTSDSFSGGAGGDATGGGGDQGILPIIKRRLSRRGSIEVDARSNTLIVTDVAQNIEAVRQLVSLLDAPEPQVEIEARIVIATRSFSRDLGVELNAFALNTGTGAAASFDTSGGALGAVSPSTVIGLTTGLIGTARISALITAAERKGNAKIVATPRVTALNNRPAQIESGGQIPIVTVQPGSGAGGFAVATTTFVSVPLRLSVTPQITDAGTVVLRVVAENNSVDRTIAVGGTPGISTQRMQTEVLVPDGGTTVIGGVLNDNELQNIFRTPGIGSLPFFGNLFKRRQTNRETAEILFFITPRVYRPDFNGRPMATNMVTGTRSTQIAQPVPLGNPETNTPTPTNLQRENPLIAPQVSLPPNSINAPSFPANNSPIVGGRP